jgi:hypothetical protein
LRLEPRLRFWTYAAFAMLVVTGLAWLLADPLKDSASGELWQAIAATTLMLHGGTAMIALVLLGALIPLHMWRAWAAGKNRATGTTMVTFNAVLVVTAFGLYYAGSDTLRAILSNIHIAAGLGLPALVALHVVLGRRTRVNAASGRVRDVGIAGALRPVISSEDP